MSWWTTSMHDPRRRRIPITGFDLPDRAPSTGRPIRHRPIRAEGDGAQTSRTPEPSVGQTRQSEAAAAARAEERATEAARAEVARAESARAEAAKTAEAARA